MANYIDGSFTLDSQDDENYYISHNSIQYTVSKYDFAQMVQNIDYNDIFLTVIIRNICIDLNLQGVDPTDFDAVKTAIESKTYKAPV